MKYFDWNPEKNELLKKERDISFEEIVTAYEDERIVAIREHHNPKRYPGQKLFVVIVREYVYLVPFVEDEEKIFLKTIIPSRKATELYCIQARKNKKNKDI